MYSNTKYKVVIDIELENGIYIFDDNSATGKTRLCKELRDFQKLGEPVIGYTYGDDKLGINLEDVFAKINPKVLLLDRYDMYNGMFSENIQAWSKHTIILLDCKCNLKINCDTDWCTIEMTSNRIEVRQ